jgi:hypothetical protein
MVHLNKLECSLFLFSVLLIFSLFVNVKISVAQSDSLVLEVEQHWDTYGVGGTCIPGGHNLAVMDIDGDGVKEIITGGLSYYLMQNGSSTARSAPLKIWNWDGKNLTLEKSYSWTGNIRCVYAGDADGDGKIELVTAGSMTNSTGNYPSLRIWTWDGETLALRGSYEGKTLGSVSVGDADGDGEPEIIAVGTCSNGTLSIAQLSAFQLNGNSLTLRASIDWEKYARANCVYVYDLDNDGISEIITAGYSNNLNNSRGQLRVWQFNSTNFILKSNEEWYTVDGAYSFDVARNVMGNTLADNVKVGDVDGDGVPEIVTGGFTYDGSKAEGQLRIWNWIGGVLNLEKSREWVNLDIAQPSSLSINDIDGDGKLDIVTSGCTAGYDSWWSAPAAPDKTRAELKVWSWDENTVTLKQTKIWIVGDAVMAWSVGTGDVDNDGITEIVTVGCMEIGNLCDPDLRIWSLPTESNFLSSFPYLPIAIAGIVTAVLVALALYLFVKRRR